MHMLSYTLALAAARDPGLGLLQAGVLADGDALPEPVLVLPGITAERGTPALLVLLPAAELPLVNVAELLPAALGVEEQQRVVPTAREARTVDVGVRRPVIRLPIIDVAVYEVSARSSGLAG